MDSLFNHIFLNLKTSPEIKPEERLKFGELKEFKNSYEHWQKQEEKWNTLGLDKLEISPLFFRYVALPQYKSHSWEEIEKRHIPLTIEHALCFWSKGLEKLLYSPDILVKEKSLFESWFKTIVEKYPKLNPSALNKHELVNIWVDYQVTQVGLRHISNMPDMLKKAFEENLVEISTLMFNVSEMYQKDVSDFKEGKAVIYGKGKEASKFRVPFQVLKEVETVINCIKDLNSRYLNKGLEAEHIKKLQEELSKLNLELLQFATVRKLRESVTVKQGASEKLLFDVLNDFLLALKFPKAISEEDELNFLKKENVTLDTIRQMKKRLIMGLSRV